jgi:hypothetical protein
MATQAGSKQQAEGLWKSYIITKPSPKGGYNGVWENPVANAPGCGFFTISRASILVQGSPLVMPGSPFRVGYWDLVEQRFPGNLCLLGWPLTGRESTQNLAHTPRKIEHLPKSVSKLWFSRESLALGGRTPSNCSLKGKSHWYTGSLSAAHLSFL